MRFAISAADVPSLEPRTATKTITGNDGEEGWLRNGDRESAKGARCRHRGHHRGARRRPAGCAVGATCKGVEAPAGAEEDARMSSGGVGALGQADTNSAMATAPARMPWTGPRGIAPMQKGSVRPGWVPARCSRGVKVSMLTTRLGVRAVRCRSAQLRRIDISIPMLVVHRDKASPAKDQLTPRDTMRLRPFANDTVTVGPTCTPPVRAGPPSGPHASPRRHGRHRGAGGAGT